MSGVALYRKYRSRSFDEVVGQNHITKVLKNSISNNRISHAYLFTGPRGVGKTSIARILAHEVNELDYDGENTHLDIIEIDAASNRRIDEIRELRDKIHSAPTSAKYKVYIIDEVHMLTNEAFNALLKTLEEPPAHAIFVLATTESHKLPDTIISRTQRFGFKPIADDQIVEHLSYIAKEEGIDIDDTALNLIARHGKGSFRDSISFLDQISNISKKKITEDIVRDSLGLVDDKSIDNLIKKVNQNDGEGVIEVLESMYEEGINPVQLSKQLSSRLRSELRNKITSDKHEGLSPHRIIRLIDQLIEVSSSRNPEIKLETAILQTLAMNSNSKEFASSATATRSKSKQDKPIKSKRASTPKSKPKESVPQAKEKSKNFEIASNEWLRILSIIKQQNNVLYAILRPAKYELEGEKLKIIFNFPAHLNRANEERNKKLINLACAKVLGSDIYCKFSIDSPKKQKDLKDYSEVVTNIMGGGEVIDG